MRKNVAACLHGDDVFTAVGLDPERIGSSFQSWLEEEGIAEQARAVAMKELSDTGYCIGAMH